MIFAQWFMERLTTVTAAPCNQSSCYFHRRRGHCPHVYAVLCKLKLLRLDTELPVLLPCPDMQPADAASSPEDGLPGRPEHRAVRKKAKRQRPVYRPKPVLPNPKRSTVHLLVVERCQCNEMY